MPTSDGGDDAVGIGGPDEGLWIGILLGNEAVDCSLEVDQRMEGAAPEAATGELGKEALDRVKPRARRRREVEGEALVPIEPLAHLRMLMRTIVVEDHVDPLPRRNLPLDHIEEADELLMTMTLHVAADHGAVEHVERGEQRGGAIALVVLGHGAGAALLQRQTRLCAIERLDLALLIEGENDRLRRRIDIEPDHIAQLLDELGVVREFELPHTVGLKAMSASNALDRADADPDPACHHRRGPVGRLDRWIAQRQRDDALGDVRLQRWNARRPGLVAQQALDTFFGESLLPAPDAGLRLARPAHDLDRADAGGAEQHDLGSPDMLLRRVAVAHQRFEATMIRWGNLDGDAGAHPIALARPAGTGNPKRTQPSGSIH